nr:hypothetical protein [Deltaproteobacteria bacterium]
MVSSATRVSVPLAFAFTLLLAAPALASPATELGEAYRAYDRNDLATAQQRLASLDDTALVSRDYALWLRGMVALRAGDPTRAQVAFSALGKLGGASRYAAQVPWRLADCAWAKGDRAAAAKQYARLITAPDALTIGDVGTARFRIAE